YRLVREPTWPHAELLEPRRVEVIPALRVAGNRRARPPFRNRGRPPAGARAAPRRPAPGAASKECPDAHRKSAADVPRRDAGAALGRGAAGPGAPENVRDGERRQPRRCAPEPPARDAFP